MKQIFAIISSIGFLAFISCHLDPKPSKSLLMGHWTLTKAERDHFSTESLSGAVLEFKDNGVVSTNLLGTEEQGTYELKDKSIIQKTSETIEYNCSKLDKDSLIMSAIIRKTPFEFWFVRK